MFELLRRLKLLNHRIIFKLLNRISDVVFKFYLRASNLNYLIMIFNLKLYFNKT